ncbi:HAMP domain-containing histidine kinase [Clostridium sp. LY3-2]|uniref:sensor histidine kinase n=1 Tax=Clostridium sp. LY3-2 TaxID=2942482 RepID=UPI0021537EE2|nr:HAMP domain-containing sensor histidine kinase [Clostridium sp. LY3-2]MCR6514097.1 HAMP domain-containing histidine kinase [Clostridium sp. LY3-2]
MIKKFKNISTFKKLSIISFFAIILVFLFSYISQFVLFRVWATKYEKDNILKEYNSVKEILNSNISKDRYDDIFKSMDLEVIIYKDGKILYKNKDLDKDISLENIEKKKIGYDYEINEDEDIYLNAPINIEGSNNYIYIFTESDIFKNFIENTTPSLIVTVILVLIFSILLGTYVSKVFLDKLKNLRETIKNIKEKGVGERVLITNPKDEFDKVNILFNSMMDEVEESINSQKRFVQDASHELKTPLTILKGHLKMLNRWGKEDKEVLDKSLNISLEEVERLEKLVNDLLVLGRVQNGKIDLNNIEETNLLEVVNNVLYDFKLINKDVSFEVTISKDLNIKILKEHLKQLMIIFIDNAIKYSDKDLKIIKINGYKNDRINITIEDNGIGILKEDLDKITDRFYRADKSRKYNNSFGIGLSVSKELIKLYKGELKISSEVGVGTKISIIF